MQKGFMGRPLSLNEPVIQDISKASHSFTHAVWSIIILKTMPYLYYLPGFNMVDKMTKEHNKAIQIVNDIITNKSNKNEVSWFDKMVEMGQQNSYVNIFACFFF